MDMIKATNVNRAVVVQGKCTLFVSLSEVRISRRIQYPAIEFRIGCYVVAELSAFGAQSVPDQARLYESCLEAGNPKIIPRRKCQMTGSILAAPIH